MSTFEIMHSRNEKLINKMKNLADIIEEDYKSEYDYNLRDCLEFYSEELRKFIEEEEK